MDPVQLPPDHERMIGSIVNTLGDLTIISCPIQDFIYYSCEKKFLIHSTLEFSESGPLANAKEDQTATTDNFDSI
jgi:hypothetical protein